MDGIPLSDVLAIADALFPFEHAQEWDNCGLQIGDPDRIIGRVAFSLDASLQTVQFAADASCGLLVTHHPLLLEPLRALTTDQYAARVILCAARKGVDIMSLHTNLDAAPGGLNDLLARRIGIEDAVVPQDATCARFGSLSEPVELTALARQVAAELRLHGVRVVRGHRDSVQRVFCASGSGMSYLGEAARQNADVMITGDIRYHGAREAQERGISLIDAGHFGTEQAAIGLLANTFRNEFSRRGHQIQCIECHLETDPFETPYESPRRTCR